MKLAFSKMKESECSAARSMECKLQILDTLADASGWKATKDIPRNSV